MTVTLRIVLAQTNPVVGNIRGNAERIASEIRAAAAAGGDIVVFPELSVCGYPPEDLLFREHFLEACEEAVRALASEATAITAIVGCPLRAEGRLYNAAAVLAGGTWSASYRKMELPNYGVFDEKRYFAPGERALVIACGGARVGVTVCEDVWVEEGGPERALRPASPGLVVNLSASPFHVGKRRDRLATLARFARSVRAPIAYVNLVGGQDEIVFDGGSALVDAQGTVIREAARFGEDRLTVEIEVPSDYAAPPRGDAVEVVDVGPPRGARAPLPSPASARAWTATEEIHAALVLGTRDYVRKNGFRRVTLGLSGGIDSALAAAIAAEALGAENVTGVTMPSRHSSAETRADAALLAKNLGIEFLEIPIDGLFQRYLDELKAALGDGTPGIEIENLQARIRGNILMALSNRFGWLVLTTGNKSEIAMGYCTLYGDTAGGFAVLKDLFKTTVYEVSELVNERAGRALIPRSTIERAPTAELRPNQKDEDSLPPYPRLDPVLRRHVEENLSVEEIARETGMATGDVRSILATVARNEYKRRQAPPGVKITPRAFGRDHRMPMTNRFEG